MTTPPSAVPAGAPAAPRTPTSATAPEAGVLPPAEELTHLHDALLTWYDAHARDLPWRTPEASAWAVMVSEFMLQQTPVNRVLPVHAAWMERWPTPASLAAEPTGEAIRMWGRLGYPRRALRLHAAATAIVAEHEGQVPRHQADLIALPGVGDYTAAAIAVFGFTERHEVLDTNVRRVLARLLDGIEHPPTTIRKAERARAVALLPADDSDAATWSVAVMELGALVCTAASPDCAACPVRRECAWRAAGFPAHAGPPRRGQAWAGTDRQCRGRMMALLREADGSVGAEALAATWHDAEQQERCLAGLLADSLAVRTQDGRYQLP